MLKILHSNAPDFSTRLADMLEFSFSPSGEIVKTVTEIIKDVKKTGDKALNFYTRKFDNPNHKDGDFLVTEEEISKVECPEESITALEMAALRIADYHQRQMPENAEWLDDVGVRLGWRWNAVESVGIYVPGGLASYPSSVLMNAIPAKIAGVERVAMVVPAPNGKLNPLILAAAKIAGVDEIYKIGGAQGIAALAYGTESVKPVMKIVGPGNAYVAEAKRQVFGIVGIDSIAGPSEILVIADKTATPEWIAADLLSQAEHSPDARSILITDSEALAKKVGDAILKFLPELPRKEIAGKSFKENGLMIIVENLEEACKIANGIAPEHLELMVKNPSDLLPQITNAGAIFLGHYTSEAIGDYIAGPSHVLPTGGTARFSSGLSVYDFLKRSSIIGVDQAAFNQLANATEILAIGEGLDAHALSVAIRRK